MLTQSDLRYLFGLYELCCRLNIFCIDFDRDSGEFSVKWSSIRQTVWKAGVMVTAMYGLFIQLRFVMCLLDPPPRFFVKDFSAHLTISCLAATANVCQVKSYRACLRETIILQREFARRSMVSDEGKLGESQGRSIYETVLLVSPIAVIGLVAAFPITYLMNETSAQFLYSVVPDNYRSYYVLAHLVLVETISIVMFMAVGVQACVTFISFLIRTSNDLKYYIKELECGEYLKEGPCSRKVEGDALSCLRRLRVELNYINAIYAPVNYGMKILCLVAPIGGFSIGIRYFVREPLFSVFNITVGIYGVIYYNILYGKAFEVPEMIGELKAEILKRQTSKKNIALISRELRAQPGFGVKMGNFHCVERASSLIYLNFIAQQICAVLLSL